MRRGQLRPRRCVYRRIRAEHEGTDALRSAGEHERLDASGNSGAGPLDGEQRRERRGRVAAQQTTLAVNERNRTTSLADKFREPCQLLVLQDTARYFTEEDQVVGIERFVRRRKGARFFTADEARVRSRAGYHGIYLPLFVAVEKIAQVARLPARASVEDQDFPLLRDGAETHRRGVVGKLAISSTPLTSAVRWSGAPATS